MSNEVAYEAVLHSTSNGAPYLMVRYTCNVVSNARKIRVDKAMTDKLKKYETIGCCGIDCGLCPRFHTKGDSACPGCGGVNFKEKHPSCGFVTCCVIKNGMEVCADCKDYPCK